MDFYHYLQIVILGIVEGVTEFLPISSTGHLLIAEHLLGTREPDIFNVVIQAGAILAVVFIYWHKIIAMLTSLDHPEARAYLGQIALAFATTTVLILILMVKLKLKLPESLTPVAWATLIGGFVIFAIEYLAKNLYPHEDISWFEAIVIGAGQVVAAIFPGASRSGSTIMAGMALGMKRPAVTEFSFLVGIPTMFAASAFDVFKNRQDLHELGSQLFVDTALGFVVSMVVAFFVVKWLLRFVVSHTFNGFAFYRVVLGTVLLIGLYTHAIPDVTNEEQKSVPAFVPTANVSPAPAASTPTAPVAPADAPSAPSTDAAPVAPPPATNTDLPANDSTATNETEISPVPVTPNSTNQASPPAPANVPAPQN